MIPAPFDKSGRFYRGNLHLHSNKSDGALEPAEVIRRYKAQGYDFVALTDHFVGLYDYPISDTRALRDESFTTILGAELHSGAMDNGELWHIVAAGLPADFAPSNAPHFKPVPNQETGPEIAQRAVDAGAFVAIAHPEWSGMTLEDARSITSAHAVEIYNHGCAVECDRGYGMATLDLLLSEGKRLYLIATDDAHFNSDDAFGGWVMVRASENSPEALLEALKSGDFYSSQGPEIRNINVSRDDITVEMSPCSCVIISGYGTATVTEFGPAMTRAKLSLERMTESNWIRVTVIDAAGLKAWSNPIWFEDIA